METNTDGIVLHVRFSLDELALLRWRADFEGKGIAEWLRDLALERAQQPATRSILVGPAFERGDLP
jgi:hypothetical protein